MRSGWTGGQYSLWRAAIGIGLAVLLTRAALGAGGGTSALAHAAGAVAALAFAIGWHDRITAAIAAIALLTPSSAEGATLPPTFALPLIAHLLLPQAPFGSFAARGRSDPGGGWRFPAAARGALWGGVAALFALAGVAALLGVAERARALLIPAPWGTGGAIAALAVPLLLAPKLRPGAWALSIALLAPGLRDGSTLGLLAVVLLLFDPAWIPPVRASAPDRVFYDGNCGLCQRWVRVLLAEDVDGDRFRLAPRASAAFASALPADVRAALPPSIVVVTAAGDFRLRSGATIRMLGRLGGLWRALGALLRIVPRPLRDLGYRAIAAVRHRFFAPPESACPLVPPYLEARFLPGAQEELPA